MKTKLLSILLLFCVFFSCDKNDGDKSNEQEDLVVHTDEITVTRENLDSVYDGYSGGYAHQMLLRYISQGSQEVTIDWDYAIGKFFNGNELLLELHESNTQTPVYKFGTQTVDYYIPASTTNNAVFSIKRPVRYETIDGKRVEIKSDNEDEEWMIGATLKTTYYSYKRK